MSTIPFRIQIKNTGKMKLSGYTNKHHPWVYVQYSKHAVATLTGTHFKNTHFLLYIFYEPISGILKKKSPFFFCMVTATWARDWGA